MKQNNTPIVLIGLTLALVAVLAIAPIVSEMAYASNRRGGGGGAGGTGGSGSTSSIASCNAPQTCSAEATPGGSGFISRSPPGGLNTCAGASASAVSGGNGASGGSGPSGAGGKGGDGGCVNLLVNANGQQSGIDTCGAPGGP